jgi:hypothetical protein
VLVVLKSEIREGPRLAEEADVLPNNECAALADGGIRENEITFSGTPVNQQKNERRS